MQSPTGRPETPQDYARLLWQMMSHYAEDQVKIDIVLILLEMLEGQPIQHAALYASGDPPGFGALRFPDAKSAYQFLDQVSPGVLYAAYVNGKFKQYQYPYLSRSRNEWILLSASDPRGLPIVRERPKEDDPPSPSNAA